MIETVERPPATLALPGRGVLAAIAVAALVGGATVTVDRPGLGWLLTGLAVTAVAGAAAAQFRVRPGLTRCLWAAAALALLAVGTVRAAGWLYAVCVPMALLCALQALADPASVRAMVGTLVKGPVTSVRGLLWAGAGAQRLAPRTAAPWRLLASAAVSVLLLAVFGALFASADEAFARLLGRATPVVDLASTPRWLVLSATVALLGLAVAYTVARPPRPAAAAEPRRPVQLVEWALPVALLDLLFGAFVLVQVAVLFGGAEHVLDPAGPTYAQYARGGFWQLLLVTGLTLVVVGVVARTAARATPADRAAIRIGLGTLAGLTLVIVTSALRRMSLYEEAYGYTRLRLVISVTELWLGLLFVLVLVAGVRLRATWLPRAVLASAALGLLSLAAADPDRIIAAHNVDRWQHTGRLDVAYLSHLSADAVPELDRLPASQRAGVRAAIVADLPGDDTWYTFNAARSRARN